MATATPETSTIKHESSAVKAYTPKGNKEFIDYLTKDSLSARDLNKKDALADSLPALDKSRGELRAWLNEHKHGDVIFNRNKTDKLEELIKKPQKALEATTQLSEQFTALENAISPQANKAIDSKKAIEAIEAISKEKFKDIAEANAPSTPKHKVGFSEFKNADGKIIKGNVGATKAAHAETVAHAGKLDESIAALKAKLAGKDQVTPELAAELKTELAKVKEAAKPVNEAAQKAFNRIHNAIDHKAGTVVDVLTGKKRGMVHATKTANGKLEAAAFLTAPKEVSEKVSAFKTQYDGLIDPKKIDGSFTAVQDKASVATTGKTAEEAAKGSIGSWVSKLAPSKVAETFKASSGGVKFGRVAGTGAGLVLVYDGIARAKSGDQDRGTLGRIGEVAAGLGIAGASLAVGARA